nr:immunoglobulin light chain junction region [Macaca mulatta]
CQQFNSDPYSF